MAPVLGDNVSVAAAPLKHSVPCVGYAVEEDSIVGHLRADVVQPVVERNKAALNEMGYRHHMSIMSERSAIRPGETREFPDGTVLSYEDILHPPRKGRKVVILGDTCDSSRMQPLAADADAVVHECTIVPTPEETEREALASPKDRFHSTPSMAGAFAKSVNAKKLFLNHFPQRCLPNNKALVAAIERQAAKSAGLNRGDVVATRDYLNVSIETNQSKGSDAISKNEE